MRSFTRSVCVALCLITGAPAFAADGGALPVREVTIFKDNYSFVLREGALPVRTSGTAVLDELPVPVLGTFWAYSADKSVTVRAVTATRVADTSVRDAANIRELLSVNTGTVVTIRETGVGTVPYNATVLSVRGESLVLLQTESGVRLVTLANIAEVTLLSSKPKLTVTDSNTRPQLTLTLDGAKVGQSANLGVMYLQKGLQWIPSYKVVIDPANGKAQVSLQATLVNDLADLDGVTAHLVIGAPNWDFKDTTDPIVLPEMLAQVYANNSSINATRFSNAIQTQVGGWGVQDATVFGGRPTLQEPRRQDGSTPNSPTVSGSESREDFYVFTVKNVRLKRGERMIIPVATFTLPYSDVYKLELVPVPPREWQQAYYNGNANQLSAALASLLSAPRVQHYLRFKNTSAYPLTTAPALLLSGDRVLAQNMMTYTPKNSEVDLPLTGASNITLKRSDKETGRVPDAKKWGGYSFEQVDLVGNIALTNYGTKPAALEVSRYVIGTVTNASLGGTTDTLDLFSGTDAVPIWWSSYNLPNDLGRMNGLGRATWKVLLPSGKSVHLSYNWRYLWRY